MDEGQVVVAGNGMVIWMSPPWLALLHSSRGFQPVDTLGGEACQSGKA